MYDAERHAELYGYHSPRQQMMLATVEKTKRQLSDKEYILNALHAVNASGSEINWLHRTGHIYFG
jgi:hypothetical protein